MGTDLYGKKTRMKVGACTLTARRGGLHGATVFGTLRRTNTHMGDTDEWRGVGKSPLDVFVSGLRYALEDSPESCGFGSASYSRDVQPLAERERVRKVLARSLSALRRK